MRFSNAAGFKQSVGEKPWYQSMGTAQEDAVEVPSKDVWGNEDPRRKERAKMRVAADDPMAAIQKGVSQLREVERERKQWREKRDGETRSLADADTRSRRKTKRKHEDEELDGFSLDASAADDHYATKATIRARSRFLKKGTIVKIHAPSQHQPTSDPASHPQLPASTTSVADAGFPSQNASAPASQQSVVAETRDPGSSYIAWPMRSMPASSMKL
ncbi:MAG: hypothetical protein Q9184_005203 [Pyrenodesmia sp. 2 TL-2023]